MGKFSFDESRLRETYYVSRVLYTRVYIRDGNGMIALLDLISIRIRNA